MRREVEEVEEEEEEEEEEVKRNTFGNTIFAKSYNVNNINNNNIPGALISFDSSGPVRRIEFMETKQNCA